MSAKPRILGLLILGTALAACGGPSKSAVRDGFFNGKDLAGWEGRKDLWTAGNGAIIGRAGMLAGYEYLVHARPVEDFRLVLEVRLVGDRGNSGIQFRSERFDVTDMKGYQADIGPGAWGKLIERNGRGPLAEKAWDDLARADDWNLYEILATGARIQIALNGAKCADFTDPQPVRRGLIGLQMAGEVDDFEVRFRNLRFETDPEPRLKTVD